MLNVVVELRGKMDGACLPAWEVGLLHQVLQGVVVGADRELSTPQKAVPFLKAGEEGEKFLIVGVIILLRTSIAAGLKGNRSGGFLIGALS